MSKKILVIWLFIFLSVSVGYAQNRRFIDQQIDLAGDSVKFVQIKTDTIFNSNQIISLLILPNKAMSSFAVEFALCSRDLKTTSSFAQNNNTVAAINGGFFNMDEGGSVTYFEKDDTVISKTRTPELKWGISDSIINGAIVLTRNHNIVVEPRKSDKLYESSKEELAVLVTGPLLLKNSEKMQFPNMKFVKTRHPRTCLCKTDKALLLITIDGRTTEAEGMSLYEVQEFLKMIGCVDAINLDGGGSTTMWTRDKHIVNFPSGKTERPVANAILIIEKKK
uniref:phosphodiester glycosidase family protein n=1 Tax=uncultured Draconibacterium sp. TaxID=1573823 RepID=UPI0032169C57